MLILILSLDSYCLGYLGLFNFVVVVGLIPKSVRRFFFISVRYQVYFDMYVAETLIQQNWCILSSSSSSSYTRHRP